MESSPAERGTANDVGAGLACVAGPALRFGGLLCGDVWKGSVMRRLLGLLVAAVLVVVVGCGSDSGSGGSGSEGGGSSGVVSAVLAIISTNIESDTGGGFVEASEGEELTVGDRVRTDPTGFAELTYHDGSWMRVENSATLTIEDLVDSDSGEVVSTSIDTGDAWSRVRELSEPDDGFELDTPVASAAVRGTAFAVSCEGDTSCTFSVVEGEVLVTPDVGDPVTLTAGQSLTVRAGEEPPAVEEPGVEALEAEPFIAENLELDRDKTDETGDTGDDGTGDEGTDEGDASGPGTTVMLVATPDSVDESELSYAQCAGQVPIPPLAVSIENVGGEDTSVDLIARQDSNELARLEDISVAPGASVDQTIVVALRSFDPILLEAVDVGNSRIVGTTSVELLSSGVCGG